MMSCPICLSPVDQPARGRRKLTCGDACAHSYRVTRQRLARTQLRSIAALEAALSASENLPWAAAIRDLIELAHFCSGSELAEAHFEFKPHRRPE